MPITYFIVPEKMYVPETGVFKTYGIAVYGYLSSMPFLVVRDVSLNGDLVFRMARMFNKYKLSPLHLMDAILDMLE